MTESAERKEKFTPGPWSKAHLNEMGCRCGYVFSEGSETVAKVLYNDKEDANYCRYEEYLSLETARANAALIAAAPDMYAALEELLDTVSNADETSGAYEKATAALAKARGETKGENA